VRDKNGFAVAYCYYEEEPGRRAAASLMTRDEARRMAVNFAKKDRLRPLGATVLTARDMAAERRRSPGLARPVIPIAMPQALPTKRPTFWC
jgi:hypothetical protein